MRNLYLLARALDYIEEMLREPLGIEDVAKVCYCSTSALQKLFGYVFRCPVSDYIVRRRMSAAAKELAAKSITDIAFEYGYGSPEAFSRAFKRVWGISPAVFRRERSFTEIFPRFELDYENGGYVMPNKRKLDISELYDELKKREGTWILCFDLTGLMSVNQKYGRAAGDAYIAGAIARLDSAIGEDMTLFRVGGDEFAVVTGYTSVEDAEALGMAVKSRNGEEIVSGEHKIPLGMRFALMQVPTGGLKYDELFGKMMESIDDAKAKDRA